MIPRAALTLIALGAALSLGHAPAAAAELIPSKVKASSTLPDADGVSYAAENAMDKKLGSFWVEGEESAGLGEYIQFDFPETVTLESIEIYPGNFYTEDFWKRHNRVKEIQVKFQTGSPQRFELKDKKEAQMLKLEAPVKTRFVRIILKGVHEGTTFNDTCISEVRFFGVGASGPSETVAVKAATASSVYDGYPAMEAVDGLKDTLWCEKKEGSGEGETLKLELEEEALIKGIRIINGAAASKSAFVENNRIGQLGIATEGGQMSKPLADSFDVTQEILFPAPVKGTTLTLTVEKAIKGVKFDDTCIAEIEVLRAAPAAAAP